jgi:hypothetical protein
MLAKPLSMRTMTFLPRLKALEARMKAFADWFWGKRRALTRCDNMASTRGVKDSQKAGAGNGKHGFGCQVKR